MGIPTEPIGSIPRPPELQAAVTAHDEGRIADSELEEAFERAVKDTLERFEATGSILVTDGEQRKPSFLTYPLGGLDNVQPGGVAIEFADGHKRELPRLTHGPFRYAQLVGPSIAFAKQLTMRPLKAAVIAPSALSLIYPDEDPIEGYSREAFIEDLVAEAVKDIRSCFDAGAAIVQMDFTEGRLAVKLDPSLDLLRQFVALNNRVLEHFTPAERERIGIHTCPGGDRESTHSADVDYKQLLPLLFQLKANRFYMELALEKDKPKVLRTVADYAPRRALLFVGVIDVTDPNVESPEVVRDRVIEAARYIDINRLGTTDDCGFSPFGDDTATSRDTAFAKIAARIEGTKRAAERLGV